MIYQERNPPYFLCLCNDEHRPLLERICAASPHRVEFVDQIQDVLTRGLDNPPLALILELTTAIRFGPERMSRFLNLGVSWPVMRCALSPDGDARVMCFEPAHGEPLLQALDGIASGDPSWQHPRFKRRHLRIKVPGRVRVRLVGQPQVRKGNLLGISCGGCFVAMTDCLPQVHDVLELELVDFEPQPTKLHGTVAWSRSWDDSLEMPGVGVEFDPATVSDDFRRFITRSPQLGDLLEG